MAHIEFGDCARISLASIEAIRDKKQEFPQKLEAITRMPVKGNYTKYMPSTLEGYDREPPWDQQEEQNLLKFEDDDFPGPLGQDGKSAAEEKSKTEAESILSASEPAGTENEDPAWTKRTNLFPGAAPAQAPTKEQLKEVTAPSARQKHDYLDPDDPDHPHFNPARYFCRYSETFTCPRPGCG
jgi:cell division protein FtsN